MSMYQPGIPTGTVNLDVDYLNLQNNFKQLDTTFGVDHTKFSDGTAQNGYHNDIHMIPFSTTVTKPPNNYPISPPPVVAGIGQLFTTSSNDGFTTDTILWFGTGGGRLLQLTSNKTPDPSNNGYTFIPGGILIQWGQVTSLNHSLTTLTFATNNVSFPNNCFAVYTSAYGTSDPSDEHEQATIKVRKSTVNRLSFQWIYETNSAEYTGFYWLAIGN